MPTDIVDVSTFTDPITTPSGGDVRDSASVAQVAQKLANRTRFLKDKYGSSGDLLLNDGAGNHPQVDRYISAARARPQIDSAGLAAWFSVGVGAETRMQSRVNRGTLQFHFVVGADIPSAGKILAVAIELKPGAARASTSNRMFCQIRKVTFASGTWTDAALTVNVSATDAKDDGTTNEQEVDLSVVSGSQTIDPTASYYVRVDAGNDGASNQDVVGRVLLLCEWNSIP